MALAPCRECGKQVSTQAPTCPNCGAARPVEAPKKAVWPFVVAIGGAAVLWQLAVGSPGSTSPTERGAPPPPVQPAKAEPTALENYHAAFALDQKAARQWLADRLLEFCSREDRHLNYIKVAVRPAGKGVSLYCVHDLYTKHALSAGSRGPALSRWVFDHKALLAKNGVVRVGVWGTGDYASGAWFEVK